MMRPQLGALSSFFTTAIYPSWSRPVDRLMGARGTGNTIIMSEAADLRARGNASVVRAQSNGPGISRKEPKGSKPLPLNASPAPPSSKRANIPSSAGPAMTAIMFGSRERPTASVS
jgi:hypothetical protein